MRQEFDWVHKIAAFWVPFSLAAALVGCGAEEEMMAPVAAQTGATKVTSNLDLACDRAEPFDPTWVQCEAQSYALLRKGFEETLSNATLLAQTVARGGGQTAEFITTILADPSRANTLLSPSSLATSFAMGDPFRHPDAPGPNGALFYTQEAQVEPVFFYDRDCARLDGKIWIPRGDITVQLPAVVINNGSVVGTQPMYFWAAQALVRAGYMVMTFDHRSQGRSDAITQEGEPGANVEPSVYWLNLIDAIDFLRSSPNRPHPYIKACTDLGDSGNNSGQISQFNPFYERLDSERLGVAGHSFGAAGATFAQSFGSPQTNPWPGKLDAENPIDVIVTWDALGHPASPINANGGALFRGLGNFAGPTYTLLGEDYPNIVPRVPALDLPSDFGAAATPALLGEEKDRFTQAFEYWVSYGKDAMVIVPHASTHTQYSQNPFLPASSWCGDPTVFACNTGWVIPMATHYTVAWFDRWLKLPGEIGYASADERLLDDGNPVTGVVNMSWHYTSARHFLTRSGELKRSSNLRTEY